MKKYCSYCRKVTRHKYKYVGTVKHDDGFGGCIMTILTCGLWLFISGNTTKLYDESCSKCGATAYGVRK